MGALILFLVLSFKTAVAENTGFSPPKDVTCPEGSKKLGAPPPKGQILACENEDGINHGPVLRWFENTQIVEDYREFQEGKLNGEFQAWYKSGRIMKSGNYVNDHLAGTWTRWFENGHKKDTGAWVNNQPHGEWTGWHENGEKQFEGFYKEGKKDGLWNEWHPEGRKKSYGKYRCGIQAGHWEFWDHFGQSSKQFFDLPSWCKKKSVSLARFELGFTGLYQSAGDGSTQSPIVGWTPRFFNLFQFLVFGLEVHVFGVKNSTSGKAELAVPGSVVIDFEPSYTRPIYATIGAGVVNFQGEPSRVQYNVAFKWKRKFLISDEVSLRVARIELASDPIYQGALSFGFQW